MSSRLGVVLVPLGLIFGCMDPVRGQNTTPQQRRDSGFAVDLVLGGGVSHLDDSTGPTASLGGGLAIGWVRLGLTPVDLTWVFSDPTPGYERSYTIAGSILCQKVESEEFVDASYCDDVSTRFGAMVDLSVRVFGDPRGLSLGAGYRIGSGPGPLLTLSWGPHTDSRSGSWSIQARAGEEFLQVVLGLSFWPRDPGGGPR